MESNKISTATAMVICQLMAYFKPLGNESVILFLVFIGNFAAGLMADLLARDGRFEFRKAWRAVGEMTTFFALMFFVFAFGDFKELPIESSVMCVSFVTYVVAWFYAQNILKNLKKIFRPESSAYRIISFLYWLLSVEFVKKIPYLQAWAMTEEEHRPGADDGQPCADDGQPCTAADVKEEKAEEETAVV